MTGFVSKPGAWGNEAMECTCHDTQSRIKLSNLRGDELPDVASESTSPYLVEMPRQARLDAPGILLVRGLDRRPIFRDDLDRRAG